MTEHDTFVVICRADTDAQGFTGAYVLATRTEFPTYEAAARYLMTVAPAREPLVVSGAFSNLMAPPEDGWDDLWRVDQFQFPRLLAELYGIGLTDEQYAALKEFAALDRHDIDQLLGRAVDAWRHVKHMTVPPWGGCIGPGDRLT